VGEAYDIMLEDDGHALVYFPIFNCTETLLSRMVQDLPAGGQRLLQPVTGYKASLVSGVQVVENDKVLAARP